MEPTRRCFINRGLAAGAACVLLQPDWFERLAAAAAPLAGEPAATTATNEDFWAQVQQAFAIDRSVINFNNGGVSPAPRVAIDALRRHNEYANEMPAHHLWQVQRPAVEQVRERLARTFGCDAEELALTRNASESLEICIYGIDLKPGDEVVTTALDYPRMINTYRQREQREGIVLKLVDVPAPLPSPEQWIEAFRQAITPRTRVLLCSHVVFLTGQINPVAGLVALGREHGLPVIIDGAHAFAHISFNRDDLDCDYYGTSLHKWTTAPHGTGFLYVRRDRIGDLWPLMAAPEPRGGDIRKFEEIGTHSLAPKLAVAEALTFHHALGAQRKEARLRYLRERWTHRLAADSRVRFYTRLDAANTCGIATFAVDDLEPAALQQHLWNKHKIFTVTINTGAIHGIRVSPNVYSTLDEIDMFCDAVEDVLANGIA